MLAELVELTERSFSTLSDWDECAMVISTSDPTILPFPLPRSACQTRTSLQTVAVTSWPTRSCPCAPCGCLSVGSDCDP